MKRLRSCLMTLLPLLLAASAVHAESDVRDIDGTAFAPNNTVVALGYFKHESSADDNHEANTAIFRMLYLMRFGNLVIAPVDLALGIADVTGYVSAGAIAPALAPLNLAARGSGIADLVYLPSFSYVIPQSGVNHTILQFNPRFTFPTGNYDATKPINIGENRFTFTPYIGVAQRFAQQFTLEVYGSAAFHTKNSDFEVPASAAAMTPAFKTSRSQGANLGLDVHLGYDMSRTFFLGASYYLLKEANATLGVAGAPDIKEPTIHSLRFNFGIRIEKGTLLMLQYNQDLHASNGGAVSHWVGVRVSHVFFDEKQASTPSASTERPSAPPPMAAEPAPAPPPPPPPVAEPEPAPAPAPEPIQGPQP